MHEFLVDAYISVLIHKSQAHDSLCTHQPWEILQDFQVNNVFWTGQYILKLFPQTNRDIGVGEYVVYCNPHRSGCGVATGEKGLEALLRYALG